MAQRKKALLLIFIMLLQDTFNPGFAGRPFSNPGRFNIGGVLSNKLSEAHFNTTIDVSLQKFKYLNIINYNDLKPPNYSKIKILIRIVKESIFKLIFVIIINKYSIKIELFNLIVINIILYTNIQFMNVSQSVFFLFYK